MRYTLHHSHSDTLFRHAIQTRYSDTLFRHAHGSWLFSWCGETGYTEICISSPFTLRSSDTVTHYIRTAAGGGAAGGGAAGGGAGGGGMGGQGIGGVDVSGVLANNGDGQEFWVSAFGRSTHMVPWKRFIEAIEDHTKR